MYSDDAPQRRAIEDSLKFKIKLSSAQDIDSQVWKASESLFLISLGALAMFLSYGELRLKKEECFSILYAPGGF